MTCVVIEDGRISKRQKDILHMQSKFYQKLYTANSEVQFTFTNNNGNKLTEIKKLETDRDLTLDELTKSVKSLRRGHTPRADGIQPEVYCVLWPNIGDKLLEAYNCSIEQGLLCLSMRRGVISLIPKKYKDGSLIKNWRPLTLLNTDFKISGESNCIMNYSFFG